MGSLLASESLLRTRRMVATRAPGRKEGRGRMIRSHGEVTMTMLLVRVLGSTCGTNVFDQSRDCLKCAKYSPDGTCVLSGSTDDAWRVFDVSSLDAGSTKLQPALVCQEGGFTYDYAGIRGWTRGIPPRAALRVHRKISLYTCGTRTMEDCVRRIRRWTNTTRPRVDRLALLRRDGHSAHDWPRK